MRRQRMKKYLLDVYTKKNEILLSTLIREANQESQDEISRVEWQLEHADTDVILSDMTAIALFTPAMKEIDRYEDGIAFYQGAELIDKVESLLLLSKANGYMFCGWNIKSYVVPVLFRAFLMAGKDVSLLENMFNTYPFENRDTLDLGNIYNFNGQQITVRARNRYSLEETAHAYGFAGALNEDIVQDAESTLRKRIAMQEYLFNLRGYTWS